MVKNTLTKIAANEAGINELDDLFQGSSAVAFVTGDPVEAAKGLRDFAKDNPALVIKGGVVDGKALSADEIKKLADLESREVLLAKLAGGMKASMAKAAATFQAPADEVRPYRGRAAQQGRAGRCRVIRLPSRPGERSRPAAAGRVSPPIRTSGTSRTSGRTAIMAKLSQDELLEQFSEIGALGCRGRAQPSSRRPNGSSARCP